MGWEIQCWSEVESMKNFRKRLVYSVFLVVVSLVLGCKTIPSAGSVRDASEKETTQEAPVLDFIGWLLYPAAVANSERQLR